MVDQKIIGVLILTILVGAVVISMQGVRIRVDNDKSTFYVKQNNIWTVSGREYVKLFDGSTQLNRNVTGIVIDNVIDDVNKKVNITKTTPYITGPLIKETYNFDGTIDDVSIFPINHKIEVINASGKLFRYEVKYLVYSGPTYKLNGETELSFGKNMKLQLQPGYRWAWVYSNGVVKAQYDVNSDYEVFNVRFYDPVITLYLNGSSVDRFYEYGEPVNITATADTGSVCVSIDAYGYGWNYSCAVGNVKIYLNAFANQFKLNNTEATALNLTANSTINISFHNKSITLADAYINLTGYLSTNYPEDLKIDIGNNGVVDINIPGQIINKTLYNTKLNNSATSNKINFDASEASTVYVRHWKDWNSTSVLFDVEGTSGTNITYFYDDKTLYTSSIYNYLCYAPAGGYRGSYVYSMGGKCLNQTFYDYNTTMAYDTTTGKWSILTTKDVPYEAGNNPCAATNETTNTIYLSGGGGTSPPGTASQSFYLYNGTWYVLGNMPAARYIHSCFLADNKFFAIGGYNSTGTATSTVYIYNFSDSTWYTSGTATPTSFASAGMAVINSTHALKVAGYTTTWAPQTYYYNYVTDTWVNPAENFYRYGHTVVSIDGIIYSIGGYDNTGTYQSNVHYWNDTDTEWYQHVNYMKYTKWGVTNNLTTYMSPNEGINLNGTVFMFFTNSYGYGDEMTIAYFKPTNSILQVGYPPTPSWSFSGYLDQKITTGNLATDFNNYLATECDTDTCDVPITVSSASAGALNVSNIRINSTIDRLQLPVSTIQSFISSNNQVAFRFNATNWGTLQVNGANFPYNGSQNITVKAHTPDYTTNDTQYLYTVFSNFSLAFPKSFIIEPIFLPDTNNSRNVSMWGQTATIPGYNITGKGYDRDFNLSIRINQSMDNCMNASVGTSNTVYNITKLNTTRQQILSGISLNESLGLWIKLNLYNCNSSTIYRNWWIELKSCCDQCMRCY